MADKQTYKTLDESEEAYYRSHPDEIDGYLTTAFEEYAKDGCTAALLAQLRMIARVKGVSVLVPETGIAQNGNPEFESINAIMHAMGYRLTPQKLNTHIKVKRKDAEKWLHYYHLGIKPTRYKLNSLVYSNNTILIPVNFKLNEYELFLEPLPEGKSVHGEVEGYWAAFMCEVIYKSEVHRGGNYAIHECLDRVFPLIGFNYRLPLDYLVWEEYEGEWIQASSSGIRASMQHRYQKLPKENTHAIVNAYEKVSTRSDKRAEKANAIRSRLKEAGELETVSTRYSFLSYYSILEIISDDLASNKSCLSGNQIAIDIAEYKLSTKGSQRTKIYFLLNALVHDFDIELCIKLSDTRNAIAHGELAVKHEDLELCKKMAFWASEVFVLHIADTA